MIRDVAPGAWSVLPLPVRAHFAARCTLRSAVRPTKSCEVALAVGGALEPVDELAERGRLNQCPPEARRAPALTVNPQSR